MKPVLLALSLAAGMAAGGFACAQGLRPPPTVAGTEAVPAPLLAGQVALNPRQLVQLVALRNPEIRYSRLGVDVAAFLARSEAALYEMVLFGSAQGDLVKRQRTVEERLAAASTLDVLDERSRTFEAGVRQRLRSGGELSLSYRMIRRANNIISSSTKDEHDTEWTSGLVLALKQPLLRTAGRDILETDLRVAELERDVQWAQFRQQVLKSTADALNLYWQLRRAQEARRLRDESVANVRKMAQDVDARVQAGRVPPVSRVEVQTTLVAREAELTRSEQAMREAEAKVRTALNLSAAVQPDLKIVASEATLPSAAEPVPLDQALQRALDQWPAYQVSRLRLQQAELRLKYADDQRKPQLDLTASYTGSGLAYERIDASRLATHGTYPDWQLGFNFEMPLGGNGKAGGQYAAQAARVGQNQLELEAIRVSLANDLAQRRDELEAALAQVVDMRRDVALREELERSERDRYRLGVGQLSQWLLRENDVFEARQRLSEAEMRAQMARVAWQFTQGTLLDEYDIAVRSE